MEDLKWEEKQQNPALTFTEERGKEKLSTELIIWSSLFKFLSYLVLGIDCIFNICTLTILNTDKYSNDIQMIPTFFSTFFHKYW
jgi:hypothetical protein